MVVEAISQDSPGTSQQSCQAMSPAGTVGALVGPPILTAAAPEMNCTRHYSRGHLMPVKLNKYKCDFYADQTNLIIVFNRMFKDNKTID